MAISCIIIDDEPLARKGLTEYIQDTEFLVLVGEYEHPVKAMSMLTEQSVQLIFLDIQMPKITGIDFLNSLQHAPLAIFTTAYPQFAVDGFELNAVDYLLKPFSYERFLKAVMKVKTMLSGTGKLQPLTHSGTANHFFIKADTILVKIRFDEILFIEALQNYVAIHTRAKKYITYITLRNVEDQLPANQFVKIHKSYIIAIDKVDSIEGNEIRIGAAILPMSRSSREEVLQRILQNKLLKR